MIWTQSHLTTSAVTTVHQAIFVSPLNCYRLITHPISSPPPHTVAKGNFKISIILLLLLTYLNFPHGFLTYSNYNFQSLPSSSTYCLFFKLISYYCTMCSHFLLCTTSCPMSFLHSFAYIKSYTYLNTLMLTALFV